MLYCPIIQEEFYTFEVPSLFPMVFSFTELYSYFGGLLGSIIGMLILFRAIGRKEVRITLASSVLIASVVAVAGTLMYTGKASYLPHIIRIDSPFVYLLGPACFFYTYATFKRDFRFRWIHLLHLLPFLANAIEFLPFYLSSIPQKLVYYQAFQEEGTVIMPIHYLLKTISLLLYLSFQVYYFLKLKPGKRVQSPDRLTVSWFWIFILVQFISMAGLITDNLTGLHVFGDPYRFAILVITTFLYSVTITLLFYPQLLYGIRGHRFAIHQKYGHSTLSREEKDVILQKLKAFLGSHTKPFRDFRLSLPEVAGSLETSVHQLSQAINEDTGLNFNDFVNLYRVEEAKRILSSSDYRKLTIDAIALKAGFHSKSPFYAAFKKHTGMTPKEFVALQSSKG